MGFKLERDPSTGSSGYQSSGTESQIGAAGSQPHYCLAVLPVHEGHVFSLALATDQTLYSGSNCGEIRASQWPSPEVMQASMGTEFGSGEGSVKAMVVVGNKVFTAHHDQKIRVWKRSKSGPGSVVRHKLVATLPTVKDYMMTCIAPKSYVQVRRHKKALWIDHHDTISALAVGKSVLYSGSWDKTIKVWRLADLKCVESISAHIDAINSLAVDKVRELLYSGSADGTVKVWERSKRSLNSGMYHSLVAILEASKNAAVNALTINSNGTICYAGLSNKSIAVWKMEDEATGNHMKNVATLRGHHLSVLCVASVANLLVSGSADKTIRVWKRSQDGIGHQCISVLHGHTRPVKCLVTMVVDSTLEGVLLYSGSLDRSVRIWWISLLDQDEGGTSSSSPDEFLTPVESPFLNLLHTDLPSRRGRLHLRK